MIFEACRNGETITDGPAEIIFEPPRRWRFETILILFTVAAVLGIAAGWLAAELQNAGW